MKQLSFIVFIFFGINMNANAQSEMNLYQKIDSIITFQIQYQVDSTTDGFLPMEWDSTKYRMGPVFSSISPNPHPVILFDGMIINKNKLPKLRRYRIHQIEKIEVYKKGDDKIIALLGLQAINGAIIIQTKDE